MFKVYVKVVISFGYTHHRTYHIIGFWCLVHQMTFFYKLGIYSSLHWQTPTLSSIFFPYFFSFYFYNFFFDMRLFLQIQEELRFNAYIIRSGRNGTIIGLEFKMYKTRENSNFLKNGKNRNFGKNSKFF